MQTKLAYWITTLFFVLPVGLSGITYLLAVQANVDGINALGYPTYIVYFLGTAKLLGAIAIVSEVSRTLKEWAYAGFAFDLLGAFYSHAASGDGFRSAVPLVFLVAVLSSYFLWRKRLATSAAFASLERSPEFAK